MKLYTVTDGILFAVIEAQTPTEAIHKALTAPVTSESPYAWNPNRIRITNENGKCSAK